MKNYWLEKALEIIENELLLVRQSPNTKNWFDRMPSRLPAIFPEGPLLDPSDFAPVVGYAAHIRMTRHGIEGVLKAPRKYHRYSYYVIYDTKNRPSDPFWLVLQKGATA